jgi:hypothetical protein
MPASTPPPAGATATLDPTHRDALAEDIRNFYNYADCIYKQSERLDIATKTTAIGLTFLTAVTSAVSLALPGFKLIKILGTMFGAAATALVAFQSTFPFGENARFNHQIAMQADSLLSEIRFVIDGDASEFERVRVSFQKVKETLANRQVLPHPPLLHHHLCRRERTYRLLGRVHDSRYGQLSNNVDWATSRINRSIVASNGRIAPVLAPL